MIIDAHQHFWDQQVFDYAWLQKPQVAKINRNYIPENLIPHLTKCGIDHTVYVQVQHSLPENDWVQKLAEQHSFIAGIVGWIDLASPDAESQLHNFMSHEKSVGIRHVVHDEPDPDFILRPDVQNGLKILEKHNIPFDLLFFVQHLPHAVTLAQTFPQLNMVIDHISKPRIKEQVFEDWEPHFRAAAQFPQIYCKLSGMITEADHSQWKVDDLKRYVDIALEAFGPRRLMYGSDWPVCELAGSYEDVFNALKELISTLSQDEQEAIWSQTAIDFYNLKIS